MAGTQGEQREPTATLRPPRMLAGVQETLNKHLRLLCGSRPMTETQAWASHGHRGAKEASQGHVCLHPSSKKPSNHKARASAVGETMNLKSRGGKPIFFESSQRMNKH